MKTVTSEQILAADDLYELQDSFCCSGTPFRYQLTDGEMGWLDFMRGCYGIYDWINENTDKDGFLVFNCADELGKVLNEDGMDFKAVCLSDDTALQKLFFWCSNEYQGVGQ
jgi:hypothetical protein